MKYMGSKARIAKCILPIILDCRSDDQWYVEPFVGGANLIDKVEGLRLGSDLHEPLIEALKLIRDDPLSLPDLVTENDYKNARNLGNIALKGYIGFALSFGGKWFGGYRRDSAGKRNYSDEAKRNAIKQSNLLQNVVFKCCNYHDLEIPSNSIVYCDPPYRGTTKYSATFDHNNFYIWLRKLADEGHKVFISEYWMPDDFECVWQKEMCSSLTKDTGSKRAVEKLFTIKPRY